MSVACVAVLAAIPVAADARGHRARPSQAKIADRLVSQLRHARTPSARERALLRMMRALHVAVVAPGGKVLAKGGPDARYLYLYTTELDAVAAAFARGDKTSAADLAAKLSAAGVRPKGAALSADAFRSGLAKAIGAAARAPRSPGSLAGLIVRRLGLSAKDKLDLGKPPPAAQLRLDPVQTLVLTAGIADVSARSKAGRARSRSRPGASASDLGSGCQAMNDRVEELEKLAGLNSDTASADIFGAKVLKWWVGGKLDKILEARYPKYAKLQRILGPIQQALDLLHGGALAYSVKVSGDPELEPPVHYPHGASAPDGYVELHVRVLMQDDYGDTLVKCGTLAGLQFPKKGGIPNVPMIWQTPGLDKHGAIECPNVDCKQTGPDGVATLRVKLDHELVPGFGLEQYDTGNADVLAKYQTAFGASLTDASGIAQYLIPKTGGVRWQVTWHKEPTLELDLDSSFGASFSGNEGSGSASYHVAGSAPLAVANADGTFSGQGPLNFLNFAYSQLNAPGTCVFPGDQPIDTTGVSTTAGSMQVRSLTMDPAGSDPGVTLLLDVPQKPQEKLHRVVHASPSGCSAGSYDFTDTQWYYAFADLANHGATLTPNGLKITGWQRGSGNVLAYVDVTYPHSIFGVLGSAHQRLELVAEAT